MNDPDAQHYTIAVPADAGGRRLDRVIADALPDLSRSRIKSLIEDGRLSLGAAATARGAAATIRDASYRVKPGQRFVLSVPPPEPADPEPQSLPLTVLFEDAHLIVIDKPAGLVVHPAPGNPDRTLVNALLAHCGEGLLGVGGVRRPGIVHRLDKDTSGVLVAAKTAAAHAGLAAQFAAHNVERAYQAVVHGVPRPAEGMVSGPIGRSTTDRKKMAVSPRGKAAVTHYRVLARFGHARPEGPFASLLACRLETGRTHQIRVHMAHIGHPLIGDPAYGRRFRIPPGARPILATFTRQALHAGVLGFEHPVAKRQLRFESQLPIDMRALIASLEAI